MANEIIKINRPFTQNELGKEPDVIKINRPFSSQELINQEEPKVGFFGKIPLSKYQEGERNIIGNIFERPGAAIRSAIQGKGYTAGAVNPTNIPKFQDLALKKYYGEKRPGLLKTIGGFGVSAGGLTADMLTEPANLLTMLAPKIPIGAGKTIGEAVMATKPMQALKKIGNAPIQDLRLPGALRSEKGGFLPSIFNTPKTDTIIDEAITKAIRPSVTGKGTYSQTQNYSSKAREAVKTIYANKDNLVFEDINNPMGYVKKLPESLNEFSSAIEQTKQGIFNQYDSLAKQAGREGTKIPLNLIAKELTTVSKNKVLQDIRPEVANYAKEQALRFSKRANYTPEEAQQAIKIYNQSLDAFYKNPTPDTASKAVIDSGIVNNLRKSLDDTILNMPERLPSDATPIKETYQQLKNQYSALKSIEKDVNRRAIVDARKNIKGLIDFTDVFSGGQMAKGILTLNPQEFATGFAQKIIASAYKSLNNPNNIIKGMFKHLDKVSKTSGIFVRK